MNVYVSVFVFEFVKILCIFVKKSEGQVDAPLLSFCQ